MGLGRITRRFLSTVTCGLIAPPQSETEKIIAEAKKLLDEGKLMQAQITVLKARGSYGAASLKTLLDEIDSKCIPLEVQPGEVKFIPYTGPIPLSKRLWICERKDLPEDYLSVHVISKGVSHLIIDNESVASGQLDGFKGLWDICSNQDVVGINTYVSKRFAKESVGQAEGLLLARRQKETGIEICIAKTTPPTLEPDKKILDEAKLMFLARTVNEYE